MSISLHVRDYCHNCPNFDPELITIYQNHEPVHTVHCSNETKCIVIERHIKHESERGVEETKNTNKRREEND